MIRLTQNLKVREPFLVLILTVVASVFFAATHAYTEAYDSHRAELGQEWFDRGAADLHNNRADSAVGEFRTALLYAPENWNYRLRLAEALTADNRTNEALGYYQSLWQSNPGNGSVNLQLARIAVRNGHHDDAERYFDGAIFGVWDNSASANRREALFEMIDFYLQEKNYSLADSQLVVLSENLPEDSSLRARVADLFLQVNDNARALEQFQEAVSQDPGNAVTLRGAAEAAFRVGKYDDAKSFIERSLRVDSSNEQATQLLDTTNAVLSLNPLEPRIRSVEKSQRIAMGFQFAGDRLNACSAQIHVDLSASPDSSLGDSFTKWNQLEPLVKGPKIQNDADLSQEVMDLTFSIEKQTKEVCGEPPAGPDRALLLLAQRRSSDNQ